MILAIGIVVDDAIIVVENIQRLMAEEGLDARAAASKAMKQITGAVIATTLVLLAVFVPVGFLPGLTGRIYQQFAVTISVSVVISSINALTLSPALCALLMRAREARGPGTARLVQPRLSTGHAQGLCRPASAPLTRRALIGLALLVGVFGGGYLLFTSLPDGLPARARTAARSSSTSSCPTPPRSPRTEAGRQPGPGDAVRHSRASRTSSRSPASACWPARSMSNAGMPSSVLKPWDERTDPALQLRSDRAAGPGQACFASPSANAFAFVPPPIPGLGSTGGFSMQLEDLGGRYAPASWPRPRRH